MVFELSKNRIAYITVILTIVTIVLYPFGGLSVFADELKLYVLTGSFVIAIWFFTLARSYFSSKKINIQGSIYIYLIFAFVFWCSLSYFWSEDPKSTIVGLVKLWFMFLFTFSVKELMRIYYAEGFSRLFLLGSAFSLIVSSTVVYYKAYKFFGLTRLNKMFTDQLVASGDPTYSTYIFKVFLTPPFANSQNILLSFFVSWIGIAIFGYYSFSLFKGVKPLLIFSVLYSLPVFYISVSKSAFIGLGVLLILYAIVGLAFRMKSLTKLVAGIVVFTLLIGLVNPFHVREAVMARFGFSVQSYELAKKETADKQKAEQNKQTQEKKPAAPAKPKAKQPAKKPAPPKDNSVTARVKLLTVAWNKFKENPIIGNGYRALIKDYMSLGRDKNDNPHNIYLQVLSEVGVIGFLILGTLFILLFKGILWRRDYKFYLIGAVIVSYMVRALMQLQFVEMDIWLLLMVLIFLLEFDKSKEVKTSPLLTKVEL